MIPPLDATRLHRQSPSLRWLLFACLLALSACATAPPGNVTVVTPFDAARFTGKWYEIARLDHGFERGLSDVSARYRLQDDGSLEVINRGYDAKREAWREAAGRAVFTGDANRGSLKVSFFGPFYGGYHVIALDPQYRWAMVIGPDPGYLWILARARQLPADVFDRLVGEARALGVDTGQLIRVGQSRDDG